MTVLEALSHIRTDLGKIPVKVEDINTIGNPIHAAILNLDSVITALENAPQQPEQTNQQEGTQPQPTSAQEGDSNGKDADN